MGNGSAPTFFRDADEVVSGLRDAFSELVDSGDSGGALEIHATLRSRLLRGLASDHVATCLLHLPGPEGLRKAAGAGRRSGAPAELVRRCLERVDAYERFLRDEGITREMLQAMATDLSPEAHRTLVRTTGQSVFRAMSALLGFSAEAQVVTAFFLPGQTPGRVTMAMVRGFDSLQRWREDAMFPLSGYGRAEGAVHAATRLDGGAIGAGPSSTLLTEFCSCPTPRFEPRAHTRYKGYRLVQDEIGKRSAQTFYFGERVPDAYPEIGADGAQLATDSVINATPSRLLQFDVFVHRSVWRGARACLATYRTVPHGPVYEENIGEREDDLIDLGITLDSVPGRSLARRASEVTGYGALLAHALGSLGHDAEDFEAHRVRVRYPLHGAQIMVVFEGS